MVWILSAGSVALFVTTALSLVVFGLAWSRRPTPGGRVFPFLFLAIAGYALVAGLESSFARLEWKILCSKLEYLGSGSTAALFLWFAARNSSRDRWLRRWRIPALWVPTLLSILLVATNELHGWVWSAFLPGPVGSNAIVYSHGPAFYGIVAQIYVYVAAGCILLVRSAIRPSPSQRRQTSIVLFAAAFPLMSGVLYTVGLPILAGFNLVPISFLLTGVVFLVGLGFSRAFDLVPVARDALVEQMSDAFLVLDAEGRIADANAAALRLLDLAPSSIGTDARRAIRAWPRLGLACGSPERQHRVALLSDAPILVVDLHVTPLRDAHGHPSGCLVVLRDVTLRHLSEVELKEVNQRLAAEVRRADALQTELREQAIRDGLTGLFNRRYLDEVLPRELERARRSGGTVCLVMIDLDHFKEVNDRLGHREGDLLLSRLGALLRERTRPSDAACRYGGEEFLIVFPSTPLDAAVARAEEIRAAFGDLVQAAGYGFPVTLSVGVSSFPLHATTDDGLLRAADEALYRVKSAGRDGLHVARSGG